MMISPEKFEELMHGPNISEAPKPLTNYEKLFGTPERAAKTMEARCDRSCVCDMCACRDAVCTTHNDCIEGVTKWLNKEATNEQI